MDETLEGADESGAIVSANAAAAYRYDNYGLLIEQWAQLSLHAAGSLEATSSR